jgi:hypothetical protein
MNRRLALIKTAVAAALGRTANARLARRDNPPVNERLAEATRQLAEAGMGDAAEQVVAVHRDYLIALCEADPNLFRLAVLALKQAERLDRLTVELAQHPEWAGLLAMSPNPTDLARELSREPNILPGLFLLQPDRGVVGAEAVFLFDRTTPADADYERWLRTELANAAKLDDSALAARFLLLAEEGSAIRRRMRADDAFRRRFPSLWDKLVRATAARKEDLAGYVGMPGLWTFLDDPKAEALLRSRGAVPVDLLRGDPAYPPDTHTRIKQLLEAGDEAVVDLLLACRGEPAFLDFLRKPVDDDLLRGVAAELPTDPPGRKAKLESLQRWLSVSVDKLEEKVTKRGAGLVEFVPFYSVYKVYESYSAGEDPSTLDLVMAAVDIGTVAVPGVRLAMEPAKAAGKEAVKQAARQVVKAEAEQLVKAAGAATVRRGGTVAANLYAAKLVARRYYDQVVKLAKAVWNAKHTETVDVTGAVRYIYERAGVFQDKFAKLTGLEARAVLERDATGRAKLAFTWSVEQTVRRQKQIAILKWESLRRGLKRDLREVEMGDNPPPPKLDGTSDERAGRAAVWLANAADLVPDEQPTEVSR